MGLWKSIAGMVQAELTSADTGGALAAVGSTGIRVFSVSDCADLTVRFWIYRRDYGRLQKLIERRGESLRLVRRKGLYWSVKQLFYRPLLLAGMSVMLFMVMFLPGRVFFVQVEGNETIPSRLILEAAQDSGIRFGASRRAVRSEKMKNELLSALPELKWAGVNTYGCVAVISVRERSVQGETETKDQVCSIIAARDGIIQSCTATKGSLLCRVGQAVTAGEVLISGYTDCGLTISATCAEGEILAQTRRNLTAIAPSEYRIRGQERSATAKYSLIIGKKRINFYKGSGIWDATCGKMYTEYHVTLPGGFQLPVTLVKEVGTSWKLSECNQEHSEADAQLRSFANSYLRSIMVAGEIVNGEYLLTQEDGISILTGEFSCVEMIGRVRYEKIGDYNGKTD